MVAAGQEAPPVPIGLFGPGPLAVRRKWTAWGSAPRGWTRKVDLRVVFGVAAQVGKDVRAVWRDAQAAADRIVERGPGKAAGDPLTLVVRLDDGMREGHPPGSEAVLGVAHHAAVEGRLPAPRLTVVNHVELVKFRCLHAARVSSETAAEISR